MNKVSLPNEVMLESSEKEILRKCINTLTNGALSKELGHGSWTVTRAEFCKTDVFLSEMQFFGRHHPCEYNQLCKEVRDRKRIGVFQFQLERTSEVDGVPEHFVGKSLLVVTDEDEMAPVWRFSSWVSS